MIDINATFIVQCFVFFILCWFTAKFVWPPLRSAIDERNKQIADGLSAADRAERELANAKKAAEGELNEAREQASGIVETANKRAIQMVDEAKETAITEGERLKAAAQAEIDQEVSRAKEMLRKEISTLSVEGASKVLGKEIDQAAHSDIVDSLAAKL